MFYRNVSDALKIIVNDLDPKINFKSWDSEIHNIGEDEEYPMFILAPMVNVMSTAVDELTDAYSISWLVIESLNEEANQEEVMIELNNMSELSKQIFLIFENTYGYNTKAINGERMDFTVSDPYTAQTVTMEKGDNRTGIAAQFTIENKDNNELCSALDCAGDGIADCDPVTVIDSDGTTVNVVESGGVFACTPSVSVSGIAYQRAVLTGQDISYALYDDRWQLDNNIYDYTPPANPVSVAALDTTAVSPFFTLQANNAFGNLDRYTDSVGGQDYDGTGGSLVDYMVDNLTGYGWLMIAQDFDTWQNALLDAFNATDVGFSDWFLPNENILHGIRLRDLSVLARVDQHLSYPPFNFIDKIRFWMSTVANAPTTSSMLMDRNQTIFFPQSTSTIMLSMYYRNHFS